MRELFLIMIFISCTGKLQPIKKDWNAIADQASIATQAEFKEKFDSLTCITDNNLLYLIYATGQLDEMKKLYTHYYYKPKKQHRQ